MGHLRPLVAKPVLCQGGWPGWEERSFWGDPRSRELGATEDSGVSSQSIAFCFQLEYILGLSVLTSKGHLGEPPPGYKGGACLPCPCLSPLIALGWEAERVEDVCVFLVLLSSVEFQMLLGAPVFGEAECWEGRCCGSGQAQTLGGCFVLGCSPTVPTEPAL